MEETETIAALRAEIAALKAQNAELTRALSEAERKNGRLRQLLNTVPGMVWEVHGRAGTPEHRFTFASDHAITMIGYRPEEVTGDKEFWRHITHPEDQARAAREIRAVYEQGTGSVQYRWLAKDGRVVWVESTFHVVKVRAELGAAGYSVAPETIVATRGRVRAGYRAGEILFGALDDKGSTRALLHIIGERPGSGHHAYSVYITAPTVDVWAQGGIDHNITKVVSGIADTALDPALAAVQTAQILEEMAPPRSTARAA